MDSIYFIDATNRFPVPSAACWRMKRNNNTEELLGTTDITGRYFGVDLKTADFRVFANGYGSVDFTVNPPGFPLTEPVVFLVRLHPGFYSGLYPGKTTATWRQSNSDLIVCFRSTGFCEEWQDDGADGASSLRTEWQYLAPEQEQVWTNCLLKPWTFPITNTRPSTLGMFGSFRFPAPGVMLGRHITDGSIVQFDFVN